MDISVDKICFLFITSNFECYCGFSKCYHREKLGELHLVLYVLFLITSCEPTITWIITSIVKSNYWFTQKLTRRRWEENLNFLGKIFIFSVF